MRAWWLIFLLLLPVAVAAETQVSVVGLFAGKAVLVINGGKPKTLSVGQTVEGVKLLAANSLEAVLEVEGRSRTLGMGQGASVSSTLSAPSAAQSALLYANSAGHFFGEGSINGRPVRFLVDTGATMVVLSGDEARRLGVYYLGGRADIAQTASGPVKVYRVSLNTLMIGGITMHQVECMVLDGASPAIALLGMSVLNRVDMRRDGIALTLTKKY